jgi:hypothetical protein
MDVAIMDVIMKLRFPASEISFWAQKYMKEECTPEEEELLERRSTVQEDGYITKDLLKRIALWKSPRIVDHVAKNDENYVKEITSWSFSANHERARIEVLTLLDGVGWPMASSILHLYHKEPYPILDFRALWSVGLEVPNDYSFEFWMPYVEFCRRVALDNGVDMRTLDRALWQYSKENQEK